jgi:hypothetical protein
LAASSAKTETQTDRCASLRLRKASLRFEGQITHLPPPVAGLRALDNDPSRWRDSGQTGPHPARRPRRQAPEEFCRRGHASRQDGRLHRNRVRPSSGKQVSVDVRTRPPRHLRCRRGHLPAASSSLPGSFVIVAGASARRPSPGTLHTSNARA